MRHDETSKLTLYRQTRRLSFQTEILACDLTSITSLNIVNNKLPFVTSRRGVVRSRKTWIAARPGSWLNADNQDPVEQPCHDGLSRSRAAVKPGC